ncbi:ATP-dependent DNA helicase DDX11 isoform X1 [Palaemon carinicauda]|uniref:ATP-dependent DNA helicase DDX11 isoform X1 n=1 Tax=Palaemon carinicauda TaxID=392227 RepID=UPI0035B5A346
MSLLSPPAEFPFPFPPYDIQQDFMKNLFDTLEKGQLGIFESPTGTGKSLSIICGALTWLRDHNEHLKAELLKKIKEGEKAAADDSDPDWFSAAAKKQEGQEEVRRCREDLKKLEKQEERVSDMKQRRHRVKKSNFQKIDDEFEKLFQDLHEVKENVQRELNSISGADSLSAEESMLLLEDYDSDQEDSFSKEKEQDDDDDDGCLKIYYCSRTHSQLSQFVREVQKTVFGEDARVVSLASRQNLCVNEAVTNLGNLSLINDRCTELQRGKKGRPSKVDGDDVACKKKKTTSGCPYYKHTALENLADNLLLEVQDLEQMVSLGKKTKSCPYYAARYAIKDSQLVILPYNTLLHKSTREACQIKLKGNVVIIDEGHNLLETIANIHSVFVSKLQFMGAHAQLSQYMQRYEKRLSPRNLLYIKQILFFINSQIKLLNEGRKDNVPGKFGTGVNSNYNDGMKNQFTRMYAVHSFMSETLIDNLNIYKLIQYIEKSKIAHKLHSFSQKFEGSVKSHEMKSTTESRSTSAFLSRMTCQKSGKDKPKENIIPVSNVNERESEPPEEEAVMGSPLMQVTELLRALLHSSEEGRVVVSVGATNRTSSVKYLLLNPASQFHDIVRECRSIIVAGGTMHPMSEFRNQLYLSAGADPERVREFSCGHVVPGDQIMPVALSNGPTNTVLDFTYQNRGNPKVLDELGRVLVNLCAIVPGGIVCFLPSYDYEQKVFDYFVKAGVIDRLSGKKKVYREPKKSNQLDAVLNNYATIIRQTASNTTGLTGAILFSVVGGKMSEGINFSDALGRCVVMVGLPYPNTHSPELKEKMQFLNKHVSPGADGKSPGSVFYENLCFKAVNQSIGRAIRHRNDYASILLLDHRYNRPTSIQALPKWISNHVNQCEKFGQAFGLIRKFFIGKRIV